MRFFVCLLFLVVNGLCTSKGQTPAQQHQKHIIQLLQQGKNDSALLMNSRFMAEAITDNKLKDQAIANKLIGIYHFFEARPDSALPYYEKALRTFEKLNDTLESANVLNN